MSWPRVPITSRSARAPARTPPVAQQPGHTDEPESEGGCARTNLRSRKRALCPGGGPVRPQPQVVRPRRRPPFQSRLRATRTPPAHAGEARSPEYSQVLERYISRLVALGRPLAVLDLFRREMDHNPNDPGLYERLATFLEQNRMDERIEAVYKKALQQFPDRSWYQKLARWYLRRHERQQFEELTRQVIQTFSGTELEEYFRSVVSSGPVVPQMYMQLNLYAHQRFPHNLTFVRNLLEAFRSKQTYNQQAWEALIRQYWFYDDTLRSEYFAYLSSGGRLDSELQAVRASNPQAACGKMGRADPGQSRRRAVHRRGGALALAL